MSETRKQMQERYKRICKLIEDNTKRMEKMRLGSCRRTKLAQFIGSLRFTQLQIEDELDEN